MTHRLSLLALLLSGAAIAAPAGNAPLTTAPVQQDLKEIRSQISTLKKDIKEKESDRAEASDALKQSASAIAAANQLLQDLNIKQSSSEREIQRVENQIAETQKQIDGTRTRVGHILKAQYEHRQSADALAVLLKQQDPNQAARDLQYYGYLSRAQQKQFTQLKQQVGELEQLSAQLQQEKNKLSSLSSERQRKKQDLLKQQDAHATLVSQLSREIASKQTQMTKLQEDQKRLTSLIAQIQQQIAERKREAARQRAEARRKAQLEAKREAQREDQRRAQEARKAGKPAPAPVAVRQIPEERVDEAADSSAAGRSFVSLKGRMRLPVAGSIAGHFGERRSEGTTWRGLFIKAAPGQAVHAVADGRVVYADSLRGFGNMLIIDHGGSYMSIYGGGDSLTKAVGTQVRAGDTVATTGSTGNLGDSGIYFEIRHQGQPLNPTSWAR